jgi:hypothetical protein
MCAVCIFLGWDRQPPSVQLEFPIFDSNGDPLECSRGHPTEPTGHGYRWCPSCRAAFQGLDWAEV